MKKGVPRPDEAYVGDDGTPGFYTTSEKQEVADGDLGLLRLADLGAVDTTFSSSDRVTGAWLAEASAASRGGRLQAPLVIGLCLLRGREPARKSKRSSELVIRAVALCVGGSRVIVYCPDRLRAENGMRKLRQFLMSNKVTVACYGAPNVARQLAAEWAIYIGRPAQLEDMYDRACSRRISTGDYDDDGDDGDGVPVHSNRKRAGMKRMAATALRGLVANLHWPAERHWGGDPRMDWQAGTLKAVLCFHVACATMQKNGSAPRRRP